MKTAYKETSGENIGTYMKSPVKTIPSDSTLREFIKQLNEYRVGSLIVSKNDENVGIVTKWDFIRKAIRERMDPETTTVSEIMDETQLTLERSTPLEEARVFMIKNKVRHIPVKM